MLLRLTCLALLLLPLPAHAQGFAIEVPVEAAGQSLEKAREAAAAKGERAAFVKLVGTLGGEGADIDPAGVPVERIHKMILGHEVAEEKFAGGKWQGTMRYRFDPQGLGAPAQASKASLGPPTGTAVLLIPVLEQKGKLLLWEPENDWRSVWQQAAMVQGRGKIVLPAGDLSDTEALDGTTARAATYAQLLPLLHRYGGGEAMLAEALLDEAANPPALAVRVRSIGPKGSMPVLAERIDAAPGETAEQLMQRVARRLGESLRGGSAGAAAVKKQADFDAEKSLNVTVPLRELGDWSDIRARLARLEPPVRTELVALSPQRADLVLHFTGDADRLLKSLAPQELILQRSGETWILSSK